MEFTFDQVKELLEKTLQTTQHNNERLIDLISQRITEFNYDLDNNNTFDIWISRFEDIFRKEGTALDEETLLLLLLKTRVRILISKLSNTVFKRYSDIILPQKPSDFSFHQTINKLTKHFGQSISTFQKR